MTEEGPLLKRAKAYDPEALAKLYDHYSPRMYAYIYRRVGDTTLAEDLTAELFLRVLRALRNEKAWKDSFVGWLYRIAHNLVVDHYRRQPPVPSGTLDESLVAQDGDPLLTAEHALASEHLRAAIGRLTQDQQQVLTLRFGEGLTAAKTAQILDKTTGAVEALQHRALAALRRILTGEES